MWESNPPLRLERAVSSADRRTGQRQEWAGGRSNPRLPGFNRPLDRLSYRPVLADPTKRPGVFVTPGPRLRARDVRGRASRPQGVERERARRLLGGSLRFLTTQDVTRTPGEHGRPRCDGCLRPTRDRPRGPPVGLVSLQTRRPERMFARFRWITGRRLVRMRKSGLGATSVLPSRPLKARMPARWPDRSGVAHARPSEAEAARSRLPSLSRPLRPSPASSRSRTRGSLHE